MDEPIKRRVDESWKERVEREKQVGPTGRSEPGSEPPARAKEAGSAEPPGAADEVPQARFDLFLQGLLMEALMALGDMPHPATRQKAVNLPQAKYLIDLLGVLEEKTKGNLSVDEERLLKDALYQIRMRYLNKAGPAG